jgi:hypothetical protein
LELALGNLLGGGDDVDWLRGKALHIRQDRTTINGYVPKAERSVFIRDLSLGRSVGGACQRYSSALAGKRAPIGSRQRDGANNRRARTDTGDGSRRRERA